MADDFDIYGDDTFDGQVSILTQLSSSCSFEDKHHHCCSLCCPLCILVMLMILVVIFIYKQ